MGDVHRSSELPPVRPGDHVCWTYTDDVRYLDVLRRYVTDGLLAGQRVACYVDPRALDRCVDHFKSSVPGADEAFQRGALAVATFEEAYLDDGRFDPDRRIDGYEQATLQAVRDGYSGLRVLGEATAMVNDPSVRSSWAGYELRADLLAARLPLIALCAYDLRWCDPDALSMLRAVHRGSFGSLSREPRFHVHAGPEGEIAFSGEIDLECSGTVAQIVTAAARDLPSPVLDVSGLRFIDVSGMRAVAAGAREMSSSTAPVQIRGASPVFKRMWELLGFDDKIEVRVLAS